MRRSRRTAAIVSVAAVAALLALPQAAPAAEKAIWGPLHLPSGPSAFPLYRSLGVDTYEIELDFSKVAPVQPADPGNPADPAYQWPDELNVAVAAARREHMNVAVLAFRAPPWANGNRDRISAPATKAFATFLAAASRRYPSVHRWMIWGEPNRDDRFEPGILGGSAPRAYARVLDRTYGALKRVSRRNIVIGGMTWTGGSTTPSPFLRGLRLPSGRRPRLDWFGHNPFPFRFPDLRSRPVPGGFRDISDLDTFIRQVHRAYPRRCRRQRGFRRRVCRGRPRLWLSEFTIQSDRTSDLFRDFVSQADQARWLRAAYGIADRLESVAGLGWLKLTDERQAPGSANIGLLTEGGSPKPALGAFGRAPSLRLRPRVRLARRVSRRRVSLRGLLVRVRPRATARIRVELRSRRGRRLRVRRFQGRPGRLRVVRLRQRLRRGSYRVFVVSSVRGATVRKAVFVR